MIGEIAVAVEPQKWAGASEFFGTDGCPQQAISWELLHILPRPGQPNPIVVDASKKRWDWKAGIDYQITEDVMVYGQAATGFRSPGFNPRPFTARQLLPIDAESLTAYELGVKSDFMENRLRVNLAGFYSDYGTRAIGRPRQECPEPNPMDLSPCPVTTTPWTDYVTGPAKIKGIELEVTAVPVDGLTIDATAGYTKVKADDLLVLGATRRITGLPEWLASVGAQYEIGMGNGALLVPRLDWFYSGSVHYSVVND
ncbi:MAG: TonB-dependent receptor, partial [Gammaproteobacteria bacterium]|nr:TonB-dependent receptor [Gammaproteobacteria bacterium]